MIKRQGNSIVQTVKAVEFSKNAMVVFESTRVTLSYNDFTVLRCYGFFIWPSVASLIKLNNIEDNLNVKYTCTIYVRCKKIVN